jgi:outer membrane protein assembly factor BamB
VVYVLSDNLYALKASTGALLWSYPVSGSTNVCCLSSSPAVVNGAVYVGSVDGNVYAFGLK